MKENSDKETIYIDAEDDVTAIIDKVRGANSKIVALVLPKRATALQSTVNLKLLKRSAGSSKKHLVLITSDPGILPIAGAVGLHVAKTLQSKPAVPKAPSMTNNAITVDNESGEASDEPLDPHASIVQLAGHVAAEETIDLDNDDIGSIGADIKKGKKALNKKLKIPDFDRFRLMLFGGVGLLLLLIIGSIFAFAILPKANITIKTDTTSVSSDLAITAKTDAKTVDEAQLIVPAISKQVKKTDSEKVPATGQRDDGTKATGLMTITNCSTDTASLPAGTVFTSGSFNFLSTDAVSVPKSTYSNTSSGFVCDGNGTKNVGVVAQNGGGNYNLSARSYQIGGSPTNITAKGSDMKGGTSKLVQIISQADIDNAKQKITDRVTGVAASELKTQFTTDNAQPLTETLQASDPNITSTPKVNEPGSEASVSMTVTYTQLGVKQDDLKKLVENEIKKHIDSAKQVIQDNGLQKALVAVTDKKSPNEVKFSIKTVAIAGPQTDSDAIKQQIAGKKKTETEKIIQSRPGIKDVTIRYSPFWVYSTPKSKNHITITFDQNNASP